LRARLLPLGLSTDRLGLISEDQVETGNIARTFSFGIDALGAGWDDFVTLWKVININVALN